MISWIGVNITDDRKRSLEEIRPLIAHIVGGAPKEVLDAVGIPPGTVKQIKSSYRKQGIQAAADYVTEACVDAFAILGSAAECIQRIKTLEAAGITQLVVLLPSGSTGQHRGHLQQFSEEIFPAFK